MNNNVGMNTVNWLSTLCSKPLEALVVYNKLNPNNITANNPNSLLGNARGLLCTNEKYHSGNV